MWCVTVPSYDMACTPSPAPSFHFNSSSSSSKTWSCQQSSKSPFLRRFSLFHLLGQREGRGWKRVEKSNAEAGRNLATSVRTEAKGASSRIFVVCSLCIFLNIILTTFFEYNLHIIKWAGLGCIIQFGEFLSFCLFFIFACPGSLLLHSGFLYLQRVGATL